MSVASLEFCVFVGLAAILFHLYNSPRWHAFVMACANVIFLSTWITDERHLVFVAGLVAAGYGVVALVLLGRLRGRSAIILYSAFLVAVFVLLNPPGSRSADRMASVFLVGYSYLMFKQIHMVIDAAGERLRALNPLTFFNYICGFYTWVSGPIQRYEDFSAQVEADRPPLPLRDVLLGIDRMLDGLFKAWLLAPWVASMSGPSVVLDGPGRSVSALGLFCFGYYLYVYLNFSGYCDIAIGAGRALGLRIPENFRWPFLARNLLDFWQRWHITLSHWLRDYVFTPLYVGLLRAVPGRAGLVGAFACLVTFDLVGAWHGLSANFLLFGLLHGVGTAFNHLGRHALLRLLGAEGQKRYARNPIVHGFAIACCQVYVALSLLVFAYPMPTLEKVWSIARNGVVIH
jgi:D-alanyl-lipoteichoic acid acyltransferase DltB (MBOAT superfamily)